MAPRLVHAAHRRVLFPVLVLVATAGSSARQPQLELDPAKLDPPAAAGAMAPRLSQGPGGDVLLSWIEPAGEGRLALRFSRLIAKSWSAPLTIAEGGDFFANWADVPSVVGLRDGRLVAHWLRRAGAGRYAYHVVVATSSDGGRSWSTPTSPHRDASETEHGFLSFFEQRDGELGMVWLDGRGMAGSSAGDHDGHGAMSLRLTTLGADGRFGPEITVDERVCECCPTTAAVTSRGPIVAYRDRSAREVRDISVTRLPGDRWTPPVVVHADNWRVAACPVNGPALAADGERVALAWFTAAGDRARVRVALSGNAGASFAAPVDVNDRDTVGRVGAAVLADGSVVVSWIEGAPPDTRLRLRQVWTDGRLAPALDVAPISSTRAGGYPRLLRAGDRLLVAWLDTGAGASKLRVAGVRLR